MTIQLQRAGFTEQFREDRTWFEPGCHEVVAANPWGGIELGLCQLAAVSANLDAEHFMGKRLSYRFGHIQCRLRIRGNQQRLHLRPRALGSSDQGLGMANREQEAVNLDVGHLPSVFEGIDQVFDSILGSVFHEPWEQDRGDTRRPFDA